MIYVRIKHRVAVHVHQVEKVLPVFARNGIHGLVRECHGVEKGVQGPFQEFHKGLLCGKLS